MCPTKCFKQQKSRTAETHCALLNVSNGKKVGQRKLIMSLHKDTEEPDKQFVAQSRQRTTIAATKMSVDEQ